VNRRVVLLVACIVAVITMACSTIRLPAIKRLETVPTLTEEIAVPLPDGRNSVEVELVMGAGRLTLAPGAEGALVQGEVKYNLEELKPEVTMSGDALHIRQGKVDGLPDLTDRLENDWDLRLGPTPMALNLNVGAAAADVDLGGLSLTGLTVAQGASDFDMGFSEANQAEMDILQVTAGASKMTLSGLADANAGQIIFRGGAGDYTMRFDGDLRRDVDVTIDAGLGHVVIIVPQGVAAKLTFEGAATDVQAVQEWQYTNDGYALKGEGPEIAFTVKMGLGKLELRNK
jgi:hypothetical protein